MKRVLLSGSILLAIGVFVFLSTGASNTKGKATYYKVEFDNAFGLVTGADFKVSGVRAGTISNIGLDQRTLDAVVTLQITQPGLSTFHSSATCDSQPQSLIGEYFISCEPGTSGPLLKTGATIPVTHTQSTIPADLLLDIQRMPEREGFRMIIDSLGAAVAARSEDLQSALMRAVPALTQTDRLLTLLANDSHTLQQLTHSSNQVVTALANNSRGVQRFITYAGNAAKDTADQKVAFQQTWHDLPAFLAQLRPAMKRLGQATDANTPVLENLHAASAQLDRLFTDLPGFAHASLPAFRALGKASVTGKAAVIAARPTIAELNRFAKPTPELAKNLSIVLPWINTQKHATERNARSPGGRGYSGLEALLQYVFNQAVSISYYGPFGHELAVDAFASPMCSPYADAKSVAAGIAQYGAAYRSCYAWLGPNQPGINETDPSNPSACVPDPGGLPPGETKKPTVGAPCKLAAADVSSSRRGAKVAGASGSTGSSGTVASRASQAGSSAASSLGQTISNILSALGGTASAAAGSVGNVTGSGSSAGSSSSGGSSQTQQLLNYLLSP